MYPTAFILLPPEIENSSGTIAARGGRLPKSHRACPVIEGKTIVQEGHMIAFQIANQLIGERGDSSHVIIFFELIKLSSSVHDYCLSSNKITFR